MIKKYNLDVTHIESLPTPHDLMTELATSLEQQDFIEQSRTEIRRILDGVDSRFLIIAGPCSIHDVNAAKEYAERLGQLAKEMSDSFLIVMRAYFEKPRTVLGWKGLMYDPHLNSSNDINTGLRWTRQLLLDLADKGIPVATEILDPASAYYFGDLISWGCIGARTTSSQTHRQLASGLPMPIAFKNSTDGNVDQAVNGVAAASVPHTFVGMNPMGKAAIAHTKGNPYGHIVLRGGESKTNYDPESISYALDRLQKANLPQRLIIDCSHDNSNRKHEQQLVVFQSVINQVLEGNRNIRGACLESNLFGGNQSFPADPSSLQYAVSLTDPCLDWATTEHVLRWGYHKWKTAYAEIPQKHDVNSVLPLIANAPKKIYSQ